MLLVVMIMSNKEKVVALPPKNIIQLVTGTTVVKIDVLEKDIDKETKVLKKTIIKKDNSFFVKQGYLFAYSLENKGFYAKMNMVRLWQNMMNIQLKF